MSDPGILRVAAIQSDTVWEDVPANHSALAPRISAAAADGADLILLPEMYACGFSMATDRTAEPADGPSATFLLEQAVALGAWVAGTYPELADGADQPTNTFLLAGPDGTEHRYAKLHPFSYAGEHEHFDPGTAMTTVDVNGVRVTLFVCYDLRFANVFWDTAERTDAYLVPANWPAARVAHWRSLLVARAIENQAYVVGANRAGSGRRLDGSPLEYSGDSLIIDPMGTVLADAGSSGAATTISATIEAATVAETRRRFPFMPDRRNLH